MNYILKKHQIYKMEQFKSIPLNIITKLKTNIFLTLSFAKDYLGKTIIELNPVKQNNLETNYEKNLRAMVQK